jgi:hypothetical protein
VNLIRIVIGSYFLAIALGLVDGVDKGALFVGAWPLEQASLAGSVVLATIATTFMSGVCLRLSTLALALFVLCSSIMQTYVTAAPAGVSAFWRDMSLVCAILLCYGAANRREVRKVRWYLRRGKGWIGRAGHQGTAVRPRRVPARGVARRRADSAEYDRMLRPLIAPTGPMARPQHGHAAPSLPPVDRTETQQVSIQPAPPPEPGDDDVDNIFCNV